MPIGLTQLCQLVCHCPTLAELAEVEPRNRLNQCDQMME